ncbi:F0F1 ATP synthase subunit A [Candidatus Nomurabacteria bacterium]|nr:F0F1 ATP synthase subunit A [Candidatus Nomurabacteria bacterium]
MTVEDNSHQSEQNIENQEAVHQTDAQAEHLTETEHEESHEITLYAEPIAHIGNFPVTNSLVTSWVAVFLIIILSIVIRKKTKRIPAIFQSAIEIVIEGALDMMDLVTNDRQKSKKAFPIVFSIFVFILINNWLGLVPGIGTISFNGHHIFRGGTADLNATLALGLFSVIAANIFGILSVGFWDYFNKFINIKALLEIPKKIRKEPTIILVNPITFFVGLIEIISEFAKVASLSFRLFGNVFAGEVLLASISAMVAWGVPLPFMFLELIVGVIQALIFAILTLVYFTIASTSHEH